MSIFDGETVTTHRLAASDPSPVLYVVRAIAVAPGGALLLGTVAGGGGGAVRFDGTTWTLSFRTDDGLANSRVWAIAPSPDDSR